MKWIHRKEQDLRDEIRAHLEIEKRERIAAGATAEDAGREARLAFGNPQAIREDVRETWGWSAVERFGQDLRFGLRMLRKAPGWTAAMVATMALGIGLGTAIFSAVYTVLLAPLPYPEPDRILALWPTAGGTAAGRFRVSAALWKHWRENLKHAGPVALTRPVANFNLTGMGAPERLQGARTTFELTAVLAVTPLHGRYFTEQEQLAGARVALLSHAFWVRRFGADAAVVGRKIPLNGEPHEVIGVMPPGYAYPDASFELWTPLYIPAGEFRHGVNHQYLAVARLRPGASIGQVRAEMAAMAPRLARDHPDVYGGRQPVGALVETLADSRSAAVRGALLALMGGAGCLMLTGCLNLALLLVARAAARSREIAVRVALGAGRSRLLRQCMAETLPLGLLGAMAGGLTAWALLRIGRPWLPPDWPGVETLGLHAPVLAFAVAASLATVILASLIPARMAARGGLNEVLGKSSRNVAGGVGARESMVVAQVALAVVLVFGGLLLGRSMAALASVSPGFEAEGVLTMHLAVTRAKYATDPQVAEYYSRMLTRVRSTPGVIDAGIVNRLPLSGLSQNGGAEFEGRDGVVYADWRTATPGYFEAMGIPLKQGRLFTGTDRDGVPPVGLIDETIARRVFGDESPVGKRFRRSAPAGAQQDRWVEIVGVVGHVLSDSLENDFRPQVYWPVSQSTQDRGALVARTAGPPASYGAAIREQIRQLDADQPVYEVRTMREWVARSQRPRSLTTALGSMFGVGALALACLGIYGVISFGAARRLREFGVRLALGAGTGTVGRLVMGQALRLSLAGVAIGLVLCWPASLLLRTMLYGVTSRDLAAWLAAPVLLIGASLLAGLGPALRAARTDPAEVLRAE